MKFSLVVGLLAVFATSPLAGAEEQGAEQAAPIDFNRDIRPLLSDRCYQCHGPEEKSREAGLRLDRKEVAFGELDSGYTAIVPGDLKKSELYFRITTDDPDMRMPPADSGKSLSEDEIDLMRRWIEQGAPWREHWAFIPPQRVDNPAVNDNTWPANFIDHFILSRLEREGLAPSSAADKETLIRRITFDLTGLPPTPEEVDAFLNDDSPEAYEKVVDRLLDSPRYGEHMARYWLDAARYGDTHGLHLDNYREMWPYRDWVVRALNENKPYDQFITEQLAGDLVPESSLDELVATGFNRCHVTTNEGGSIKEEVYVRNVIDRVTATGTIFMGMTFECARCHDHKYDPFTQKDFYSLFAFFNSLDGNAMDGNKAQHPPVVTVPDPQAEEELKRIRGELAQLQQQHDDRKKQLADSEAFVRWQAEAAKDSGQANLPEGMIAYYPLDETAGDAVAGGLSGLPPGKVNGRAQWASGQHGGAFDFNGKTHIDLGDVANFERDAPFSYGAWVNPRKNSAGAIVSRMNDGNGYRGWDMYLQGNRVAVHIIHRWNNDALKVATKQPLKEGQWQHVFATYDGSSKAAGVKIYFDGKEQPLAVEADSLKSTTKSDVNLRLGSRTPGSVYSGLVDDVRIYGRTLSAAEVAALAGEDPIGPILATDPAQRTPEQKDQLVTYYLNNHDPAARKLNQHIAQLRTSQSQYQNNGGTTLVWKELAKPRDAFILKRGEYDQRLDKVERATPAVLPPMPAGAPLDRLGLARWLVDPAHPLTARVAANRFWQQVFGTGIVKTSEDFGSQGEPPSHPQLLDALAVEFRESGWNVKHLMKTMVMSSTYRQSSKVTPQLLEKDPANRLLARGPRFRLDAEMLRDQALAVSGLLVNKLGGPSVKPPQPDGLWFAVGYSGSNTVRFKADKGPEKVYRRTLYTFIKRTAPPPQMSTFDAPSRESCTVRRERTNTPLQMLLLMNDPQYVEAARALAERSISEGGGSPAERAAYMFRLCTARRPDKTELDELTSFYEANLAEFEAQQAQAASLVTVGQSPPDDTMQKPELAAWTMVANLVLCLDEVVTKN